MDTVETQSDPDFSNAQLQLEDIPQLIHIHFLDLADNYRWSQVISTSLFWLVPVMIIIGTRFFIGPTPIEIFVFTALAIIAPLGVLFSYYSAKACGYAQREQDILFKKGLLWKKVTSVSFNRIQHIDINHGPLDRYFHLANIKFYTAGGSLVDLRIPGLPQPTAERIRAFILEKATTSPEVEAQSVVEMEQV